MTSAAAATFTAKNLALTAPPADLDVGITTTFKKKWQDATLSLSFSDATLKDPRSLQGVTVTAERPIREGVKGAISYDAAKRSASGWVTLSKPYNGSNLDVKASYKQAGDVFTLEETWRFDANNKLAGAYNFSTEEAVFAYTHTRGPWSATSSYNFKKDTTTYAVAKKQGKATLTATYAMQDKTATLVWAEKPFKAQLKAKVDAGSVAAPQASLTVTHEFEL